MKSFKEYNESLKPRPSGSGSGSNKIDAMSALLDSLKKTLSQYDISTRRFVWERLNSAKGKELMEKILRNPKTYLSDSEFTKLVIDKK